MVAFYNKGDQNIYKDFQYVPQEQYRLGFTAPTAAPTAAPVSGGITNTNAFTNSGGNGFNQSGNAFGYGSPVSEVNVRTFNPQSLPGAMTPGGQNANTVYNQAFKDLNNPSLKGMSNDFVGKRAQDVMDYANESIMDNKEQYGAQGQYTSPYDDTVDQSKYTKTIGSFPSQGFFNRMRNKGFNLMENIPYIGLPTRIIRSILPEQEDNGPGGGTYGVAGLSDAQKEAYNTLASQGMLFDGTSGFKTSTGKNFTGKGYLEGQREIFNEMTEQGYGMDEDGNVTLNGVPLTNKQNFKKLKYKESSALFKDRLAKEKALQIAEKNRLTGLIGTRGTDPNTGTTSTIQGESGGNTPGTSRASDHGKSVGLGHNAGNVRDANRSGTGSAQGHNQNLRKGGRAGYFFGGRVNFKNGGLAGIL